MLAFYLTLLDSPEDRDKIALIYNKYYSLMAYTARKYVKNESDVQDIVHDCMMRIIECIDRLDLSVNEKTRKLCTVIARNRAIDFLKVKKNSNISLDDSYYMDLQEMDTPLQTGIDDDSYNTILKSIESMNDTYRDVCMLKFAYELKEREIAALLGLSEGVVSMRACRGRKILQEQLRKEKIHD